jgi:hypothetical protein
MLKVNMTPLLHPVVIGSFFWLRLLGVASESRLFLGWVLGLLLFLLLLHSLED